MSIDEYRKGCQCPTPPVYDPNTQHSSLVEHLPKYKKEREHLTLVNQYRGKPFNETIPRFAPEYWVVDYNALMVATIIPYGSKSFRVPCHWRTNKDFLGVRWMSEDTFSHYLYQYEKNVNYSGLVLAFKHNPDEPDKFTVTIQTPEKAYTYRLSPYGFDSKKRRWVCLDTKYGTKRTYQEDIFSKTDDDIPESEMTAAYGTKDYIYILDFSDLRTGASYKGEVVNPRNVTMVSFDCTEAHHGLGRDAYVATMYQNPDGTTFQMEIGGIHTNAALTKGDSLQLVWQYMNAAGDVIDAENEYKVISYTGFGTSNFSVKCAGILPGAFVNSPTFYGKYLQADGPIKQVDTVKWFSNLTVSGSGLKTLRHRKYTQIINGMGMTSGFDDGYNLTPERQVKMAYGLGYRDWWTAYIGMSHYWKGLTAFQDKATGSLITEQVVLEYPILFAGEGQIAQEFINGAYPDRGIDIFRSRITQEWGINLAGIRPINGATEFSCVDKLNGEHYWWDIENDTAGPALLNAVAAMGELTPKAIVWGQGVTDAHGITLKSGSTVARVKQATRKVFEYLRNLYGNVPILIQEVEYNWGLVDLATPNVPIRTGLPTYLAMRRTSWGDIELRWKSYKLDPSVAKYRIEIYHPQNAGVICHSFTVSGKQEIDGYVYADWTVENSIPVFLATTGSTADWTYLKWRVVCLYANSEVPSGYIAGDIPLDNKGLIKKSVVLGINQFAGGYFTDLSDGTSKPVGALGRKDKIAASTLRLTIASNLGLRPIEVMPINVSVPDSTVAYGEKAWWNTATNSPNAPLIAANTLVKSLGIKPDYFIEGNSTETLLMKDIPVNQWEGILNKFQTANASMLAWLRTQWENPNLTLWFQGATTTWFGIEPPSDVNSVATAAMRDKQISMATSVDGFKLGSFVPSSNSYSVYLNQNNSWIYYKTEAFHATAADMGEAIAQNINRALNPPDWVSLRPPVNLVGRKQANRDIKMTWDTRLGVSKWCCINRRVDTGALISQRIVSNPEFVFSVTEQQSAYAGDTLMMNFTVSEYAADSDTIGAGTSFMGEVANGNYMVTPKNLAAEKKLNGDIVFTWTGRGAEWPHFWVENFDVTNPSKKIFSKQWSSESLTWTVADQNAYYKLAEGGASVVQFMVSEYDPSNGLVSIGSMLQGAPSQPTNPMNKVTNLYAVFTGDPGNSSIKIMWDASPMGGRDILIRNMDVSTGNPITENYTGDTSMLFTRQQQVDHYGFTVSSVTVKAQEHDLNTGSLGLTTVFTGNPQSANALGAGYATKDALGNITMEWDKGDGSQWLVEIINAENSSVVKSVNVVTPVAKWSVEEITETYGYLTDHVIWRVRPYREDGASNVMKTYDMTAVLA